MECAAEIVCDVVFTIGESTCSAEAAHDAAAFAADTAFDFFAVDGAAAFMEGVTCLKYGNIQTGLMLHQFVCGKNAAGACADNDHIIVHWFLLLSCLGGLAQQLAYGIFQYSRYLYQHFCIGNRNTFFPFGNGLSYDVTFYSQSFLRKSFCFPQMFQFFAKHT